MEDARNWVEYTNESANTYWAQQRRKNGRDKPWGVKIWGLGNEIDGPWQLGHKNAEDYAKFALEAAKAMRRVDDVDQADRLRLVELPAGRGLGGLEPHGARAAARTRSTTSRSTPTSATATNNFEQFLAVSRDLDDRIEVVKGQIQAARVGNPNARPIHIAFDEWNVWYRARPRQHGVRDRDAPASRRTTTSRTRSPWACSSTRSSATPTS